MSTASTAAPSEKASRNLLVLPSAASSLVRKRGVSIVYLVSSSVRRDFGRFVMSEKRFAHFL